MAAVGSSGDLPGQRPGILLDAETVFPAHYTLELSTINSNIVYNQLSLIL